ncbi:hypothetical protein HAX54_051539 [Datura stramonium]|uniref:Serine/threonine-protein phosphatase 4 regulatory subunit 3-like central domain-containing protein n=1 Tax=Datura stramonium TaxID=4076 RepID=A0ABS8RRB1_DATST|nr:hypothetical protein [Datura stramonium]
MQEVDVFLQKMQSVELMPEKKMACSAKLIKRDIQPIHIQDIAPISFSDNPPQLPGHGDSSDLDMKKFLKTCLVGSFSKWLSSSEVVRNWVTEAWNVADGLKITQLGDSKFMFRHRQDLGNVCSQRLVKVAGKSSHASARVKDVLTGPLSLGLLAERVKVYRLNDDGKWDDQGTGHVTVDYLERSEEPGLLVTDEDEHETLLLHRISADDIYRKQEDTIISWKDPEYSTELALSFQETTGCSYIWDSICSVQRNMQFSSLNYETFHSANSDLRELPPVELSTLPLILKTVVESGVADQLLVTELILHDQDFFGKLMDLFRICEDLENVDSLHIIFKIVRGIILLNSSQILEKIFGDELILDIIGCLEYDPEAPHIHHRIFLKEHILYKEAIPIKDVVVLSKIRQTYIIGYLKDVMLAQMLDEATIANLNSIISSNNAMVVSRLKDDNTFIQELFAKLRSPTTSAESKKNLSLVKANNIGREISDSFFFSADILAVRIDLYLWRCCDQTNTTKRLGPPAQAKPNHLRRHHHQPSHAPIGAVKFGDCFWFPDSGHI